MTTSAGYIEPMPTGGSSRSHHLSSRNPYRAGETASTFSGDDLVSFTSALSSRNPYSGSMNSIPRRKPLPPSRETSFGTVGSSSRGDGGDDIYSATPPHNNNNNTTYMHPLFPPPRPDAVPIQRHQTGEGDAQRSGRQQQRPPIPQRPHTLDQVPRAAAAAAAPPRPAAAGMEGGRRLPPPALPPRPPIQEPPVRAQAQARAHQQQPERAQREHFFAFRRRVSQISSTGEGTQVMQLPPRRLFTTEDVPVNSVTYARNPEKVVAYLIPLPTPMRMGQPLKVPQRYMIYTPPAPHLLKPQGKEGKRHKAKRVAQEEVKKAKTYSGKTLSLRGLHSKTLRGVDWVVAAIKNADITFLNRVPRKEVGELLLLHPASVLETESPEDVHREFVHQLARTRRKAAKHSVISTALFPPALVIDTFAAVIWPFGGLAEIDGVWMYTSMSGYLTARSVSKRLDQTPSTVSGAAEQSQLARELHGGHPNNFAPTAAGESSSSILADPGRQGARQVRFQEELDDEDEKLKNGQASKGGKKQVVKVRMVPDEAMDTMNRYFQEICHKRNPKAFPSPGVPPTQTEVLASIGWQPEKRVRAPGQNERDGVWEDENWQNRQVKEDMDRVMMKAAKTWDKWCKSYARYPQRAMKEKGHSVASEMLRKLHLKKDDRTVIV